MVYYCASNRLSDKYDKEMQRLFPTNSWGCVVKEIGKDGVPLLVEICKLTGDWVHGETTWEHHADIVCVEESCFELHERFCGEGENEMWIYGYFKTFLGATRNLARVGNSKNNRKPKAIYLTYENLEGRNQGAWQ